MAIEIVDCPIKNGDFPWQNVSSPEGSLPEGKCAETLKALARFRDEFHGQQSRWSNWIEGVWAMSESP